MVLPIGLMCCQHQHLGYLPIFGCIGCVQHHVGNVAIGERLYAFVTDRVRTSTSEWISISLISFNFSVFRPLSRCSKLFNNSIEVFLLCITFLHRICLPCAQSHSPLCSTASPSQASPQHSSCKQACLALHSVCTDIRTEQITTAQ